jgi:hypothetical protein
MCSFGAMETESVMPPSYINPLAAIAAIGIETPFDV